MEPSDVDHAASMILVCGEALVDLFIDQQAIGDMRVTARLGGAPFNVAVGLARLGVRAAFLGGLSTDVLGRALEGYLAAAGVDLSYAVRSTAPSMLAIVTVDESGRASYSFPVRHGADRSLSGRDIPEFLPNAITAITFGSYPIIVEPTAALLFSLAVRERDRVICLDPNVRPTLVTDMSCWRAGLYRLLPFADIVKTSADDIHCLHGEEASIDDVARDWLRKGAALVVVTQGASPTLAFMRCGAKVSVGTCRVDVADTVGAGDSFLAAFVGYLQRRSLLVKSAIAELSPEIVERALTYANAAGAITCTRRGADLPGHREIMGVLNLAGISMGVSHAPSG